MERTAAKSADLLQGTLELLILRTLASGEKHGYEIAEWIDVASADALAIEEGALYPALHRLELRGLLAAEWDVSANNRRAKSLPSNPQRSAAAQGGDRLLAPDQYGHQSGTRHAVIGGGRGRMDQQLVAPVACPVAG